LKQRLNKIIAQSGIASRRKADELIREGRVTINGKKATVGELVNPAQDCIKVGNRIIGLKAKEYYLFHKPKGCLTTRKDPDNKPTIYGLLPERLHHLFPVGRLDFNTSGLLILTNDGDFAQKLTHPTYKEERVYQVKIKGTPDERIIALLKRGFKLEDGRAHFDNIRKYKEVGKNSWFVVTVSEGRNRLVRRAFEKFNYTVVKLKRIKMGKFELRHLKPGDLKKVPNSLI